MSDLFESTEDRVAATLEAMANPAKTLDEVRSEQIEQSDRTWRRGMDPMDSVNVKDKKDKPPSHTTRTRDWWEERGHIYTPVEYRDVYGQGGVIGMGVTHDMLGFVDAIVIPCVSPFGAIIALQNTSVKELANHVRNKVAGREVDKKSQRARVDCAKAWLSCGGRILLQAWGSRADVDQFLDSQRHYKVVESYRNKPVRSNTKWFSVVIEIDMAIIEGVESRRRK